VNIARTAAFTRILTVLSATWTSLLAMLILYWQLRAWILTGDWSPVPISRALALAGLEHPAIDGANASWPQRQLGWFFDLPASGFLFAVAAILVAFAILVASIETNFSEPEE